MELQERPTICGIIHSQMKTLLTRGMMEEVSYMDKLAVVIETGNTIEIMIMILGPRMVSLVNQTTCGTIQRTKTRVLVLIMVNRRETWRKEKKYHKETLGGDMMDLKQMGTQVHKTTCGHIHGQQKVLTQIA